MSTPPPPSWPYCAHGAAPGTDPVGCRGIHVPGHTACLAHLTDPDRAAYLTGLTPGSHIDHPGTPFTENLLDQLLDALRDPATGNPHLGDAWFDGAYFSGRARFDRAQFSGHVGFGGAQFSSEAEFDGARFTGPAGFDGARFAGRAGFDGAQFSSGAGFEGAEFFDGAVLAGAQFSGDAGFRGARFGDVSLFGPVVCAGRVVLAGAVFGAPVTLEIAAREVACERTRWDSTATIRLRCAAVDLSHAVLSAPVAVIAHPTPFTTGGNTPVDESLLTGPAGVRVTSVQGVDAAHLVLTDTDLTDCLFSGAFHLDQLRLEGRATLAPTPTGWHHRGIWPIRWTRRRTLAEEHHWRAQIAGQAVLPAGAPVPPRQWHPGPHHPDPALSPDPEDVAALYRQLRKAFEDGKNEPGAADFYYGECEMRRHDTTSTAKGERRLLWAYWLLSGYGLRASRATGWLLAAMTVTVLLLMGVGDGFSPEAMRSEFRRFVEFHFERRSHAAATYDWYEEAARLTGNADMAAKARAFGAYCIEKRADGEAFLW